MRIVFAGTPTVAVPALRALQRSTHSVSAVVTRDDAPLGRKRRLTPSPVAQAAADLDIPVIKANRLDESPTSAIAAHDPDIGVIVAYGGLVREPLLSLPRLGWINLHFSALPDWRGAAPVQHALIAGDRTIGTTVFQLTTGLDEGDVWYSTETEIEPSETAGELLDRLAHSGAVDLVTALDGIAAGTLTGTPQVGEPRRAGKLTLADGRLDLRLPADEVYNRFRGVTPEPGAFVIVGGERFKIRAVEHAAQSAPQLQPGEFRLVTGNVLVGTATTAMRLLRVQPAGKTAMDAAAWWHGQQGRRITADLEEST